MAAKRRIIIDTDPGVDDVLAMLLALSAQPDELEVLLISVTFGNVEVEKCLRNVVTLFHHINLEMKWRESRGLPPGFDTLRKTKPVVAVGASEPLADHKLMADYFHGIDGLGGIHDSHPHLSPLDTWHHLFDTLSPTSTAQNPQEPTQQDFEATSSLFIPSNQPAHEVILDLLQANDPDTITLVVIGPATNAATAAATDPETFLRVKEVVVMGGTLNEPGNVRAPPPLVNPHVPCPPEGLVNAPPGFIRTQLILRNQITPVGEFNVFADSLAAARLLALTSPTPRSTMPPMPPVNPPLPDYPAKLSRPLKLTLFPLDATTPHALYPVAFSTFMSPRVAAGSPMAIWISAFLGATFQKLEGLYNGGQAPLALHDPLCIWYLLCAPHTFQLSKTAEDIRIETGGQWTRGMCVIDRRGRSRREDADAAAKGDGSSELSLQDKPGDTGNWLRKGFGNGVWRCVNSDWKQTFGEEMLKRIFAAA